MSCYPYVVDSILFRLFTNISFLLRPYSSICLRGKSLSLTLLYWFKVKVPRNIIGGHKELQCIRSDIRNFHFSNGLVPPYCRTCCKL